MIQFAEARMVMLLLAFSIICLNQTGFGQQANNNSVAPSTLEVQQSNHFYYDRDDRLIGAEYSRGISIAYAYDGNGNLVGQTVLSRASETTDGLPVLWRYLNGLTNNTGPYSDSDKDGWTDYQEWKAGTDPKDPSSTPNLLSNSGSNIATLSLPFPPNNFVVGTGQLDGLGSDEIVIGADGNPGTNSNFLLVLTQGPTNWSAQRVDVGPFGITSITVGQPTNRPSVGIYVGLRATDGNGRVMEFTSGGGIWQSNMVASSTDGAAFAAGIRQRGDLLATYSTASLTSSLFSLVSTQGNWAMTVLSTNTSIDGLATHGEVFSHELLDSTVRVLATGEIEVLGGSKELFRDDIVLPENAVWNPATGKWHFRTPSPTSWREAESYFASFHGNITLPKSSDEDNWLNTNYPGTKWLGLYFEQNAAEPQDPRLYPHYADGSWAPYDVDANSAVYRGYHNWSTPLQPDPRYFVFESPHGNGELYWDIGVGDPKFGIGEVTNVLIFTNEWSLSSLSSIGEHPIFWPGALVAPGSVRPGVTKSSSIILAVVDDKNHSETIGASATFVFAEYQISGNSVRTTVTNIPIETKIVAPGFGLAAVDFLGTRTDDIFTAEPSGSIYSWSAANGSDPLQRQLFTEDYSGKAWHALAGVKIAAGGEGLVGLMVDPADQSTSQVMFWPPQAVLPSVELTVIQTAPVATLLPSVTPLGGLANVTVTLSDAEGNVSVPFLQFQPPGSTDWMKATILFLDGKPYSTNSRVAALPNGTAHTILWDAQTDLGAGLSANVLLRARAQDISLIGEWSAPTSFMIDTRIDPDSDGDGMPDAWEVQFFGSLSQNGGADSDQDGSSDLHEYIADTDPTDAKSRLQIGIQLVDGGVRIDWSGGTWATEILQQRSGFDSASAWVDVFTNLPPTSNPASFTNSVRASDTMFYRIRVAR